MVTDERGPRDQSRERNATLNQVMFGVVALILSGLVLITVFTGDVDLFFSGVALVFVVSGATLVIPWNRLPHAWLAIIPLADAVAVTVMRLSSPVPESAIGLLWVFPAMWLASGFGLVGFFLGFAVPAGLFLLTVVISGTRVSYSVLLLVIVLVAVAGASYLNARRSTAQRALLDKQARMLATALERARRQEQAVTEVLDAVDFGVIRIGASGAISVTNDAHARLQHALGPEQTAADDPTYDEDGVTPLAIADMPFERALRGEAVDGQIVWFGGPDDQQRVALSVSVHRLRDGRGEDAGAVLISRDVTAELTALRARNELVASVSHELRTPLTSILGYLDLAIEDEQVPANARRGLEIAERNAERLLGIVADILSASSDSRTAAELAIDPADIDVADVLYSSAESLLPRAAERAVTLDASGIEPAHAYADPKRLRQVVDNLISNAIKYNRDGGRVTLGSTRDGDSTFIVVRDTGVGMVDDEMSGLFARYYRAQSQRGTGRSGTGLGLAISRELVRAHGGDITVRSVKNVGSTFMVRLPATRAAASPAPHLPASIATTRERKDEA